MKKILALTLALTLALSCLCINVAAATGVQTLFNVNFSTAKQVEQDETILAYAYNSNSIYSFIESLDKPNAVLNVGTDTDIAQFGISADVTLVPTGETPDNATVKATVTSNTAYAGNGSYLAFDANELLDKWIAAGGADDAHCDIYVTAHGHDFAVSGLYVQREINTDTEIYFVVIEPEQAKPTPGGELYGYKVVSVNGDTNVSKYISSCGYEWCYATEYTKDGDKTRLLDSDVFFTEGGYFYTQYCSLAANDGYYFNSEVYIISKYDGVVKDAVIYDNYYERIEFDVFYDGGLTDWTVYDLEYTATGPIGVGEAMPSVYLSAINGIPVTSLYYDSDADDYLPINTEIPFNYSAIKDGETELYSDVSWNETNSYAPFFESFNYFDDYHFNWYQPDDRCDFRSNRGYSLEINTYGDFYVDGENLRISPESKITLKVPASDDVVGSFSEYYYYEGQTTTEFTDFYDVLVSFFFNMGAENMSGGGDVETTEPDESGITISLHTPVVGEKLSGEAVVTGDAENYTDDYLQTMYDLLTSDGLPDNVISMVSPEELQPILGDGVLWRTTDVQVANGTEVTPETDRAVAGILLLVDEIYSEEEFMQMDIRINKTQLVPGRDFNVLPVSPEFISVPEGKMLLSIEYLFEAPFGEDEYYVPESKEEVGEYTGAPVLSIHTPVVGKTLDLTTDISGYAKGVKVTNFDREYYGALLDFFNYSYDGNVPEDILAELNLLVDMGGRWQLENYEGTGYLYEDYSNVQAGDVYYFYALIDLGVEIPTDSEEAFYNALLEDIGFTVNGLEMEMSNNDENGDGLMWIAYPYGYLDAVAYDATPMASSAPEVPEPQGTLIQVIVCMIVGEEDLYFKPEAPAEDEFRVTGWFMTGDKYHAMIIGHRIISMEHVFDENGKCTFCNHTVKVEEVIAQPSYESETEEVEEDNVVVEDKNPDTGIPLALIPLTLAICTLIANKRR